MTTLPTYDLSWEMPVKPSVQRSDKTFKQSYELSRKAILDLTGVDYVKDDFKTVVEAIGTLRASEHGEEATRWLLGVRYWHLASQDIEVRLSLPSWFWEETLEQLTSSTRFEAMIYVAEDSFEAAIERWANKSEGVPLAAINFYRKKRKDAWALLPEHTFLSLYAS